MARYRRISYLLDLFSDTSCPLNPFVPSLDLSHLISRRGLGFDNQGSVLAPFGTPPKPLLSLGAGVR